MEQAFNDLWRERCAGSGAVFWWHMARDWGGSWMDAWKQELDDRAWPWLVAAGLAVLPGLLFFGSVILIDLMGLGHWEPVRRRIMLADSGPWLGQAVDGVVVLGPLLGLALALVAWLRQPTIRTQAGRAALLRTSTGRLTITVLAVGLLLTLAFVAYFFTENWACLVGQAVAC